MSEHFVDFTSNADVPKIITINVKDIGLVQDGEAGQGYCYLCRRGHLDGIQIRGTREGVMAKIKQAQKGESE